MEENIKYAKNYVNWFRWVSDAKRRNQTIFESRNHEEILVLLQVHETKDGDFNNNFNKKLVLFNSD
jgi:hypothetical protein